jgi:hypothetical protein
MYGRLALSRAVAMSVIVSRRFGREQGGQPMFVIK